MGGKAAAERLVSNIRVDDQMGVILPQVFDDKGNPLVKLELLKAAGAKQADAGAAISRYNQDMLNTVLAGFVQFGQTPTGSRSLHMSATQIFSLAIGAFMDSVAAVMNRIAIPRLLALNKMDLSLAPTLVPGEIGVRDLEELSGFVQQLSSAGLTFFDKETSNYIRKVGRLPEIRDEEADKPLPTPPQTKFRGPSPGEPGGSPAPTPELPKTPPKPTQKPEPERPTGANAPKSPGDAKTRMEGVA